MKRRRPTPLLAAVRAFTLFALRATGCGASAPPAANEATAPAAKAATPAAACLDTANAHRERKPNEPPKVGVKHVLVKAKGGKRADASITRTREEACLRAIEARDKLRNGADFAEIVKEYSDEPGAATRGGSVGTIERTDVAPAFADAAFELDIGQMSDVVETEFGFHVIQRVE